MIRESKDKINRIKKRKYEGTDSKRTLISFYNEIQTHLMNIITIITILCFFVS